MKIKQHPFFEGTNWELVKSMTLSLVPELVDYRQVHQGEDEGGRKSGKGRGRRVTPQLKNSVNFVNNARVP
jgi:hypothetical protein